MANSKVTETSWYPKKKLLVTHISGDIGKTDIEKWENSLKKALNKIENNESFKMFVNMYGFKAVDIDAHKRFRGIVPLTLADYGWKVGYVNLFEKEAKTMIFKNTRGIRCVAVAYAHQDETKMDLFETRFGSDKEHFFKWPTDAIQWIEKLDV